MGNSSAEGGRDYRTAAEGAPRTASLEIGNLRIKRRGAVESPAARKPNGGDGNAMNHYRTRTNADAAMLLMLAALMAVSILAGYAIGLHAGAVEARSIQEANEAR